MKTDTEAILPEDDMGDNASALHRLNAAHGLLDLGAVDEALRELDGITTDVRPISGEAAALRLHALSMKGGPDLAGRITIAAAFEEDPAPLVVDNAIIEALNLKLPMEALRLAKVWNGDPESYSSLWHNMAAAHVMLGSFDDALESVFLALRADYPDPGWCLLDAHLAPLWHHLAEHPMAIRTAWMMRWPGFPDLADAVMNERGIRPLCWHTAHLLLPADILSWMHRGCSLHVVLKPGAPRAVRRRLVAWLDNRRRRMARVLRTAVGMAHGVPAGDSIWAGAPTLKPNPPIHLSSDDYDRYFEPMDMD